MMVTARRATGSIRTGYSVVRDLPTNRSSHQPRRRYSGVGARCYLRFGELIPVEAGRIAGSL